MTLLTVALGSSARSNVIDEQQQLTLHALAGVLHAGWHWGKLAHGYADENAVKADKDTRWFSLAKFRAPVRNGDNVESVSGFVGDFDKGTWSPDEVATLLTGYQSLIYTTYSNSSARSKFRLVVPYTQPVSVADHGRLWHYFNGLFDGALDGAAKDAPRLFYFPSSCPDTGPPVSRFELRDGAVFDPVVVLATSPPAPSAVTQADDDNWTDAPRDGSVPIADDELVRRMVESGGGAGVAIGGRPHVRDLLNANADALARAYPSDQGDAFNRSGADQACANALMFWTRGNCEQIERIMRGSALMRDKYDRNGGYLRKTILKACADHTGDYYKGRQSDAQRPNTAIAPTAAVPAPPGAQAVGPAFVDMPLDAARSLIAAFYNASGMREIHYWQSGFMAYEAGIYVPASEDGLRSLAWKFFEHAGVQSLKSKQVNEVMKALEGVSYLPEKTPVPCWLDNPKVELPDLLICQNGAFDLATGTRYEPTPNLFATIRLPVDYAPEAPPPVAWLGFLSSLWPDDAESIATLQELFGLMLTPITKFQKIFLLVGPKRSGKGTILRTLRKLLGNDNVAGPALSTLAHQYGMQCLIGKLAALIGDARINARSSEMSIVVERLLSISGEDSPNVERKFLPDWTGRLPTRIVMSSNELPHLDDPSGAMASRFVILVMQASFIGREDLELESKLAPEMPAILNWAIEGRRRLLERGRFLQPASGAAAVEQMAELSSSVAKFVRECCTVGAGLQVLKDDLYRAWRTWCAANGEHATHSGLFGRDLVASCSAVKPIRPREPATGKPVQMYGGIALTDSPAPAPAPINQHVKGLLAAAGSYVLPAHVQPAPIAAPKV